MDYNNIEEKDIEQINEIISKYRDLHDRISQTMSKIEELKKERIVLFDEMNKLSALEISFLHKINEKYDYTFTPNDLYIISQKNVNE